MSSYYRRHAPLFQFASLLYLMPCNYNSETDQFERGILNTVAFTIGLMSTVPFWYLDMRLMVVYYLHNISPIMVVAGSIEIIVYVSIVSCTLLNVFLRRRRITRLMTVLFRPDWLLDRYGNVEAGYENRTKFVAIMGVLFAMVCCNMFFHEDANLQILSVSVAMKIFGISYLTIIHRVCVGAIGMRMEQLQNFLDGSRGYRRGHGEQMVQRFVERFELYAAQVPQVDRCFSFPLTLVILLVLIEMVYLLYDCFTVIHLERPTIMENLQLDFVQWTMRQLWQLIYCALVLLIVTACQRTSEQLRSTIQCLQHFDDYRYGRTRTTKQIQRFVLKNLDRETNFSACGLFDIDYTMLYMVLSSTITYMVILIQFDQLQPERLPYATRSNGTNISRATTGQNSST